MVRIPYKTFFIRMASTGLWWVEKDGKHFMAAHDENDARRIIDRLTLT